MNLKSILLPFLLIFSLNAFSQKIGEISIQGLSNISRGTLLSNLPVEVGDDIPNDSIQSSIYENLLKTNFFESVKLKIDSSTLVIEVVENPVIKYFDFKDYKDNEVLNDEIISDLKDNFNLNNGKIYTKSNLDKLIEQLKVLYSNSAFFNTQIKAHINTDEKNRIGIELVFDEGEKALIKTMRIRGNKYFEEDDLLDLFDIGEPDFFLINYFTEKDHFSKPAYKAGIDSLINKYTNEGFLDVAISKEEVNFINESNEIEILISLKEGTQYKVGEFVFTGELMDINPLTLREKIEINDGEIFKRSAVISAAKAITRLFQDQGYAFSNTSLSVKSEKDSDLLKVILDLKQDAKIYIDRINIEGNHRTQDDVIRRELNLLEGAIYSKTDLDDSIKRIKRLGYFSDVSYSMQRHAENNDKIDLLINVIEQKTGEISLGLSHSNATGAAVTAGISQNNILGTGNTLDARISNSEAIEELSFYFKNPHINNQGHSLSYGFTDRTTNASDLDASNYVLDESGFSLGYGVPLADTAKISAELKLSDINLTCGSSLRTVDEIAQCNSNDSSDLTTTFTYINNSLNDFYFPTDGTRNILKTTISLPLGDFKYYRFESSYVDYEPVLDDKILKISSRFNTGAGYGGDDLPFYKRFYEGGSSSVRGFDFNSLGAKYTSTGKPKGGELSWINSLAIGAPSKFIGIDNDNMRVSLFADSGLISEKQSGFDFNDFRASSGIALSWLTPIGPIGIHYALPIIKKDGDATSSFQFELGTSF
jgi:outer membrane protein insertion porin family